MTGRVEPAAGEAGRAAGEAGRARDGAGLATDGAALETRELRKEFGRIVALAGLTMTVPRGEVFGFLGPNGAGKTTAVKLLLGLSRPTSGDGRVLGAPLGDVAARRRVGYLPELFRYQGWMTAREVLALHCELARLPRAEWRRRSGRSSTWSAWPIDPRVAPKPSRRGCSSASAWRSRSWADPSWWSSTSRPRLSTRLVVGMSRHHRCAPRPRHDGLPQLASPDRSRASLRPRGDRRSRPRRGRAQHGRTHARKRLEPSRDRPDGVGLDVAARYGPTRVDGEWLFVDGIAEADVPPLVAGIVARGGAIHAVIPTRHSLEERFHVPARGGRAARRGRGRPCRRRRRLRRGGRSGGAAVSSLDSILIVARLTLREAVRRRLLWTLVGLTVLIVVLTWWGFSRISEASPITGPVQELGVFPGDRDAGLHVQLRPGHDGRLRRIAGDRARHRERAAPGRFWPGRFAAPS